MPYRDQREALQARVEVLERELAEKERVIETLSGGGSDGGLEDGAEDGDVSEHSVAMKLLRRIREHKDQLRERDETIARLERRLEVVADADPAVVSDRLAAVQRRAAELDARLLVAEREKEATARELGELKASFDLAVHEARASVARELSEARRRVGELESRLDEIKKAWGRFEKLVSS